MRTYEIVLKNIRKDQNTEGVHSNTSEKTTTYEIILKHISKDQNIVVYLFFYNLILFSTFLVYLDEHV